MAWKQHIDDSWFRTEDYTYAGKDHTKNNKTFICISEFGEEVGRFKTLESAKNYADENWPIDD